MNLKEWQSSGQYYSSEEGQIFYRDYNSDKEDVIVILHGYPTSSLDYADVIQYFPNYRIVVHDHLGFGLSAKPIDSSYLLTQQADIALELWKHLGISECTLIAHDYGTSVATELLARFNAGDLSINFKKLVLSNGSMLIDMSQLRPIQKLLKSKLTGPLVARMASFNTFKRNMNRIASADFLHEDAELKLHWNLLIRDGGRNVLPKITRYIDQRYDNYDRWIGALKAFNNPTLLLWGVQDPVAVIAMVDKLESIIPINKVQRLDHCGHYPMIEDPQSWSQAILDFIN